MKLVGYEKPNGEHWFGRVDDTEDYDSFRWHQHVKFLDLTEEIDVANVSTYVIIGYEVDQGTIRNSGRGGSTKAPNLVRENLSNRPCSFDRSVTIYDGGTISCINDSVEDAQNTLSLLVDKILRANMHPIVIGGGHDVAFGNVMGISKYLDNSVGLGIINFDAHFDNRPYTQSTSGTMFRQIYDVFSSESRTFNHLTIGAQKSSNTVSLFDYANSVGSEYILARDILPTNIHHNTKVIKAFLKKCDKIYLTICSDVFSTAYAPGVSSPQPLGMYPDDFMVFFKLILDSNKVISFDIAEVVPKYDQSNASVSLVALIIYTLINYSYESNLD